MWLNMIYQIHALHCFAKISVFDMSNKEMLSPSPAGILTQDICGSNKHVGFQKQWPFQVPKLEVPTIYKAYFSGLCKGISPENMAKHMVRYLHFILEFPLTQKQHYKVGPPR